MKIMYIGDQTQKLEEIKEIFSSEPYTYIHYRDPKKAVNNLKEVEPDIVVYCENDFPIQKESFLKVVKHSGLRPIVVVLGEQSLAEKEEDQLFFVPENLKVSINREKLYNAVTKNIIRNELEFIFTHPVTPVFISGRVKSIRKNILEFLPDNADSTASIVENSFIPCCTIKLNDDVVQTSGKILKNSATVIFELDSKPLRKLSKWIKNHQE